MATILLMVQMYRILAWAISWCHADL